MNEDQIKEFKAMQAQMLGMQALLQTVTTENSALKAELVQYDTKKKEESEREKRIQEYNDKLTALLEKETQIQANIAELRQMITDEEDIKQPQSEYVCGAPFAGRGREEKIELTFGSILTAKALREFIEHYKIVRMVNIQEELKNWDDPAFRAAKLRLTLRGAAAEYVTGESGISMPWTQNDEQIIKKLEERYLNTDAIELKIIEVEEAKQEDREPLPDYLSRVQRLVREAYRGESDAVINKRIAWKFLSGIQNREIRASVIKEKWMKSDTEAKSPDEILLIAETTRRTMAAVSATSSHKPIVGAVGQERRAQEYDSTAATQERSGDYNSSRRNSECKYCKRNHPGGWEKCYRRQREAPNWTPDGQRSDRGSSDKKKYKQNKKNVRFGKTDKEEQDF